MNNNTDSQNQISKKHAWIQAMRLRTLPLSLSGLILGSSIAYTQDKFSFSIFFFLIITGVLLQILSDFANDYGDAQKNLDGEDRVGPKRAVASGVITPKQMKKAIIINIILIAISSLILFVLSFATNWAQWGIFSLLALSAILAAMFYTMGKNPYGYRAQGEIYVFIFFGLVAVLGSFYLFTDSLANAPYLPAIAAGLFSSAVLNINNTRDMEGDKKHGKYTLAIKFGPKGARKFHISLIALGLFAWIIYLVGNIGFSALLLLLLAAPIVRSAYTVYTSYDHAILDKQLKITAMGTGLFHILVAILLPFFM